MVVFAPERSYIKNITTGQTIDLIEEHGTHHLDVEYLAEGFTRLEYARAVNRIR